MNARTTCSTDGLPWRAPGATAELAKLRVLMAGELEAADRVAVPGRGLDVDLLA